MVKNIFIPKEITSELAEETGWHIGDGSMNFHNSKGYRRGIYQLRGHMEDDREHYISRIKPIFKLLYKIDISLRDMPSTRVFGFQIWSSNLINFKQRLGLPLGKKFDVVIPDIFLGNDELIKSVIRGIFDTDGGIYLEKKNKKLYPIIYISTISKRLADQLLTIFKNLGFRTTCHNWLDNKEFNRQRAYRVVIRGNEMFDKFILAIKPANPKHINKYRRYKQSLNNNK